MEVRLKFFQVENLMICHCSINVKLCSHFRSHINTFWGQSSYLHDRFRIKFPIAGAIWFSSDFIWEYLCCICVQTLHIGCRQNEDVFPNLCSEIPFVANLVATWIVNIKNHYE